MPLYKTINHSSQTTVLVWHIQESENELMQGIDLTQKSHDRLQSMQSDSHRKGFLSVRQLLKIMGYGDKDLFYTPDGKPHLIDGKKISITHSFDFSAIIVSKHTVGIDIEKNREKILKIGSRFMDHEVEFIDQKDSIKFHTVVWAAKESLYKIHPDGGLLFKKHLPIEKFCIKDRSTRGWIHKDSYYEVYDLYFTFIKDFTLVYAVND